jgi:hypothetical protein
MPKPLAEVLLALFTGHDRAAVLYGDLLEMSATRGRVWFCATYTRTLISLAWRAPVAFASGILVFNLLTSLLERWIIRHPALWRTSMQTTPAIFHIGPLLATATIPLWFALPYAFIRYGSRDRLVRLAALTFLLTTLTFLYLPYASLASAVLSAAILLAAFASATWRRPAIVLMATIATGAAAFVVIQNVTSLADQYLIEYARLPQLSLLAWEIAVLSSMALVAVVCSRMHTLLLRPPRAAA